VPAIKQSCRSFRSLVRPTIQGPLATSLYIKNEAAKSPLPLHEAIIAVPHARGMVSSGSERFLDQRAGFLQLPPQRVQLDRSRLRGKLRARPQSRIFLIAASGHTCRILPAGSCLPDLACRILPAPPHARFAFSDSLTLTQSYSHLEPKRCRWLRAQEEKTSCANPFLPSVVTAAIASCKPRVHMERLARIACNSEGRDDKQKKLRTSHRYRRGAP